MAKIKSNKTQQAQVATPRERTYWGKKFAAIPELDLLGIQKESYDWFTREGIK